MNSTNQAKKTNNVIPIPLTEPVELKTLIPDPQSEILKNPDNVYRVRDFIEQTAPPMEWTINGFLPKGIVAFLASPGGTGKSFLSLDMGFSIASESKFLNEWQCKHGRVLMVLGEEKKNDIHTRIKSICKGYNPEQIEKIGGHIDIVSVHGQDPRLIEEGGKKTSFYSDLFNISQSVDLIILDPMSRFYKADENDSKCATSFVEALEQLTIHGATVLICHHTRKPNNDSGNDQSSVRGSTAFVDGSRWVMNMRTMSTKEVPNYCINEENRKYWVECELVKANNVKPIAPFWLKREEGGILVKEAPRKEDKKSKGNKETTFDKYSQ